MSTIDSTQPSQTDTSQPTQNTTQALATLTPHPTNHQTPARGRGSCGRRGGGAQGQARGGRAAQGGGQTQSQPGTRLAPCSWTKDCNQDGLLSNSTVSKWEVCELINQYLINNGGEIRLWCGIEQQVTTLDKKICDALAWQDKTGQGILDDANELARQAGDNPKDEDFVGNAITETKKKRNDNDDLTHALNLNRNKDVPQPLIIGACPNEDEMTSQTNAKLQMNHDQLDTDNWMVNANITLINALSQGLAPTANLPEHLSLQNRQLKLDVQLQEVEIAAPKPLWPQRNLQVQLLPGQGCSRTSFNRD
ncbi:hypothetical protein PGTUg99_023342 [Puccinia graminis f. sp. tritici]|uniref:Uncharacterized protein n=1 Tax=Puccinia graminis f. sp. tritici TaxID=56615 RepID=A0A5B0RT89_PUCGR|nr:hypothetical protein PGTUg99_023342 [Puccinia graminis f. sp. tritici]